MLDFQKIILQIDEIKNWNILECPSEDRSLDLKLFCLGDSYSLEKLPNLKCAEWKDAFSMQGKNRNNHWSVQSNTQALISH